MFGSVLIANRGEIACRIARTAKRLGLRTIAVYSAADADALHVRVCDEAYPIGPAPARDSYLSIERLIEAATAARAECIHPGYGFLSENAEFAEACAVAGIVFVGPPPAAIRAMGLKDRAKALMEAAGVPVVPGYHGERQEPKFLKEKAYEIGYPVLIKPAAGGGGRGLRRVERHAEFDAALEGAIRESASAFGSSRVLIEKYVAAPRHIEIQIFADRHGSVIHLGERDCTLQRRHQKIVEEAPAPGMPAELRAQIGAATVEFVADGSAGLRAGAFWFIEMNTRLQVEHPVTEAVTGLDLVEWQFRVAAGEKLPALDVALAGHAGEARVYAEDPERGFLPSTGRIIALELPAHDGIRVDAGVEQGAQVTPFYDPLIAKVIAHAPDRGAALEALASALDRTLVAGPRTNLAFLAALCRARDFRNGRFDTGFIDRNLAALGAVAREPDRDAAAAGVLQLLDLERRRIAARVRSASHEPASPWDVADGFQLCGTRTVSIPVSINGAPALAGASYDAHGVSVAIDGVPVAPAGDASTFAAESAVYVLRHGRPTVVRLTDFEAIDGEDLDTGRLVLGPMHGKLLAVLGHPGAAGSDGQRLAVIEAMKMEHALLAPFDGKVVEISAAAGDQVAEGAKVMTIEPSESEPA